ncbi:Alkaline phosphodiesterase I / Nucleotide pyrophosphatase [Microbacterium esteraromaticum]|uniref:Alkaline phosphodiesterase I / Nucleotide pyrophosphatase n=1 Tax=Microbacterium esteraromaticum TaxID=57043 RepID=A0A1R4IUR8_9MICO|nr:nucleotide pyrophosphatase/phosphodiesterase family protein [Microbacterium esteraromaticum]SJN23409.1 Alkaline phosphodiesterase I / Nucleotide pyrophosphatase [Microbacterium esteraromaticum]
MSLMLPSSLESTRNITGVAHQMLASLRGASSDLPAARSVVLVVVDGLGAIPLRAHSGHARTMASAMAKKDVAMSVFPTTTAAALTSLLTGVAPGEHGLVGYRVLDRARDALVNQLTEWKSVGIDPLTWQSAPTIFEQATAAGHPAFVVGIAAYAGSGFTSATLRGAEFHPAASVADRVALAWQLADAHDGALVYCYLPEVDKAGHKHGIDSGEWVAALEDIDAALALRVPDGVGVLVTADHGMVDVPVHKQLVLDSAGGWHDGIRHIGGEPRMLHVYAEPDADQSELLARWRQDLDGVADVVSRAEAIDAGLYGSPVTDAARSRIGDMLVISRSNVAIYDGEAADQRGRAMVGQHGGLTPEEWRVPFIRLGKYRR